MTFFRPEAVAAVLRWREVLVGLGLGLLGLWLVSGPGFLLAIPGYAFVAGGIALIWMGIQRGRFRGPDGGAGAVQVVEGQIAYFGPLTGGTVALGEIDSLTLEGGMHPAHWRLTQKGQPPLLIPVNAAGADALFDAFAALPGLKTERMLGALQSDRDQTVVIWHRPASTPPSFLLH